MWTFERRAIQHGYTVIAGVDEAGRGPLAGPVVSAAVILPQGLPDHGITDSKKLSARQRERLHGIILDKAVCVATGMASPEEIDTLNILQASLLSMKRAVQGLMPVPDFLLVDGLFTINHPVSQEAIVKGDSRSISIAAASIIAKVTRDAMMMDLHHQYPEYGFDRHKGYPTRAHREALARFGPSPVHRVSFRGVVTGD
ncbi:MAG: ribonuclease HII [Pseudomonadota bacterium]